MDFDNTLLDIESLTRRVTAKPEFSKAYIDAKKPTGYFDPKRLPQKLQKNIYGFPFKKHIFPNAFAQVKKLKKIGRVILFTHGDPSWQGLKIRKTGIGKLIGKKNILIVQDKLKATDKLIRTLRKQKYAQIVIFDDTAEILEKAFNSYAPTVTVWIRYGRNKDKFPTIKNSITLTADSFGKAAGSVQRLVNTISLPKAHQFLPVLKGIEEDQVSDLISYTGKDRNVSVCTHDDKRFKNKKTFASWRSRGKIIYTLTTRTGKLLGIVWFARKKFKNFHSTIAVRTYPPVRGKGLSYKFTKSVITDFQKRHKKTGLWLVMQKGNIPAGKLYKKLGFVKESEEKGEVYMTLTGSSK